MPLPLNDDLALETVRHLTGSPAMPPGALAELAALRAALPGYDVTITSHSPTHRFEVIRRHDGPGPCCLISSDPADLWRELAGRARPAALDGDPVDRALLTEAGTGDSQPVMMLAVADKLRDKGIDVRFPDSGEAPCLSIMNAEKARSDVTVDDSGYVLWEYWPVSEGTTNPADITAVALAVLGGNLDGPPPSASRALTLKGAVGQALRARGMNVTMAVYQDGQAFEVAAEVIAVNPVLPECGRVRVTDDGYITWEYRHDDSPGECAHAVIDTIVPVLIHGINGCWPPMSEPASQSNDDDCRS